MQDSGAIAFCSLACGLEGLMTMIFQGLEDGALDGFVECGLLRLETRV